MDVSVALLLMCLVALGFCAWRLREEMQRRSGAEAALAAAQAEAQTLVGPAGRAEELTQELASVRERLSEAQAQAAQLSEREAAFVREREALTAMRTEVEARFNQLAQQALSQSQESFLKLAGETLAKQHAASQGDLKANEEKLRGLLKPVEETFAKFGGKVEELERSRLRDQSALGAQIRHIAEALEATRAETGKLATALRAQPKTRGRWGEEQLRNILELAGMSAHCDFHTERGVRGEDDRLLRPDATVRLPGGGVLVIDAKTPMQAYLDAVEAADDAEREAHLQRHAQQVRAHARQLASKKYWDRFEESPDFVAMFIPGENFFAAASERDPNLFQDAVRDRVIVVTPATLVALAKAAAFGWRQEEAARRAQDIAQLGKALYERLATFGEHMQKLGKTLDAGVRSYNAAVGSLESKVMPGARKFLDLNAFDTGKTAPELAPVDSAPRGPIAGRDLRLAAPADGGGEAPSESVSGRDVERRALPAAE